MSSVIGLTLSNPSAPLDPSAPPAYSQQDPYPSFPSSPPPYDNINSGASEDEDCPELVPSPSLEKTMETQTSFLNALPRSLVNLLFKVVSFFRDVKLGVFLYWKGMFCGVDRNGYSKLSLEQVRNYMTQVEDCLQNGAATEGEIHQNNYYLVLCTQYLFDPSMELSEDNRMLLLDRLASVLDRVIKDDKWKGSCEQLIRNLKQIPWDISGQETEVEHTLVKLRAKIFAYSNRAPDSSGDLCAFMGEYFLRRFCANSEYDRQRLFELLWECSPQSLKKERQLMRSFASVGEWTVLIEMARKYQCPLKFIQNISYALRMMAWNQTDISFWIGQVNSSRGTVLQELCDLPQAVQSVVISQLAKDIVCWAQENKEMLLKQLRSVLARPQMDCLHRECLTKLALQAACRVYAAQDSSLGGW